MKYIYLIELKSNKYFVELSNKIINDLKKDFYRFNYPWTRKYEPVKIIEIIMIEDCDIDKLDEFVEKYMSIYGMENVRGGKYDSIILENENETLKLKLIDNSFIGNKQRNDDSLIKVWFCNHCGQDFTSKEKALKHEAQFHKNQNCFEYYLCC